MKTKKTRRTYPRRNWKQDNAALGQRGSLTLWVSEHLITAWRNPTKTGNPGKPPTYSDTAVWSMATLKEVYPLPRRPTKGLILSRINWLGLDSPVMPYSRWSRRCATLEVAAPRRQQNEPLHLVADSTG